ncbi:nexin 1 [Seminavis robusta]|uniref:Nexin 1 n=1 Tax=Seminavis robusta TaxID=568900 RepID=A0A9N8DV98_9STRA|nr:nexin 1 [Seminavis robusta]|eukprot:Sro397_g134440.1 nexin 1 (485) ;mRNA; r:22654-24455
MADMATLHQPAIQRRARPEDAAMHITVSDPVQHQEGMNKYTSYRVDVRPQATPPPGEHQDSIMMQHTAYSAVLRRYSDFFWLYERLHTERAGAVVPPIPEKTAVGRFSPQFIEDRRMNLERFLRRVAVHPELADAPCLDTFLRADDATFHAAKQAKGDVASTGGMSHPHQQSMTYQSPPKKEGLKRWFAEAKTSIAGDLVKSPDDDLFDEISRYIHSLDSQMKNVSHQASALVRKGKEIANGLFEFGLAFNLLGQSEADALGDALGRMGDTADRLSVLSADHAEKEMAQFEEPLQDYLKMIHAVKLALQRRHEKRLTYSTCLAEVEAKQVSLGKLQSQMGQDAKAYAAEMSLRRAQQAAEVARDDFATVSQRVLREVDRFKREKAEDMRRTVLDYINLQVDYNKRMEQIWTALVPQLEKVQLDSHSNAIAVSSNQDTKPAPSPTVASSENPPSTSVAQQAVPPPSNADPASAGMLSVQYRDPVP